MRNVEVWARAVDGGGLFEGLLSKLIADGFLRAGMEVEVMQEVWRRNGIHEAINPTRQSQRGRK